MTLTIRSRSPDCNPLSRFYPCKIFCYPSCSDDPVHMSKFWVKFGSLCPKLIFKIRSRLPKPINSTSCLFTSLHFQEASISITACFCRLLILFYFFWKIHVFKKFFHEYHPVVKQFRTRSGPTFVGFDPSSNCLQRQDGQTKI